MSNKAKQNPGRREVYSPKAPSTPLPAVAPTLPIAAPVETAEAKPQQTLGELVKERLESSGLALMPSVEGPIMIAPRCRRGHMRAKVVAPGVLHATGYTLFGEYRTTWTKGEVGEFPKASVDGIVLVAQ